MISLANHALMMSRNSGSPIDVLQKGRPSHEAQIRGCLADIKADIDRGLTVPQMAKKYSIVKNTLYRHLENLLSDKWQ